ncbi:MAG: hypothetical protein J6Y16_05480 [Treponema sp.]|nr:hypothetical protein [Treponema sp.]
MKKSFSLFAILALIASVTLTSCLSIEASNGTVRASSPTNGNSTTVTIKLDDNCPNDDTARAAQILLKAANKNYQSVITFSYKGTPDLSSVKPISTYYANCLSINAALKDAYGKSTLSFNTKKDGSGATLDFSSSNAILSSLLTMALYNYTEVYAIYKYK